MENENWILARKPLSEKSIADNVLKWGVGGINIDGCRVEYKNDKPKPTDMVDIRNGHNRPYGSTLYGGLERIVLEDRNWEPNNEGRFPANFIYCGDDEVLEEFEKAGVSKGTNRIGKPKGRTFGGGDMSEDVIGKWFGDEGTPARFFFNTKE